MAHLRAWRSVFASIAVFAFGCGADAASGAPADTGADAPPSLDAGPSDGDARADTISDASRPDAHDAEDAGPCGLECSENKLTACTCQPSDPCGYKENGRCEQGCYELGLSQPLDDGADCDLDQDDLLDFEELSLANRFSPALIFAKAEKYSGKMPHFAVRKKSATTASIFYALSYFEDGGDPETGLTEHLGDSEFVVVDVSKKSGDWAPTRVYFSAHYAASSDSSAWVSADDVSFDVRNSGRHPLVWVAIWKHANYPTQADCEKGALGFDHCENDGTIEVLTFDASRNLGSSTHPLVTEVRRGQNSEFYWRDLRFCGWKVADVVDDERKGCAPSNNSYAKQLSAWLSDFAK